MSGFVFLVNKMTIKDNLTKEEIKILFKAVRYWQRYQPAFEGKEYKIASELLNKFTEHLTKS